MAAKVMICLVLSAMFVGSLAQLLPISGTRDITGGYLDHYTGQYSSALSGRVYNQGLIAPAIAAPAIAAPALAAPGIIGGPILSHGIASPLLATHGIATTGIIGAAPLGLLRK